MSNDLWMWYFCFLRIREWMHCQIYYCISSSSIEICLYTEFQLLGADLIVILLCARKKFKNISLSHAIGCWYLFIIIIPNREQRNTGGLASKRRGEPLGVKYCRGRARIVFRIIDSVCNSTRNILGPGCSWKLQQRNLRGSWYTKILKPLLLVLFIVKLWNHSYNLS